MGKNKRRLTLRHEENDRGRRNLWASLDEAGNLHIDGQDLGSATAPVSSDGEYEWFSTISAHDVPRLLALLSAPPDADILDTIEQQWSGAGSYELERLIRESDIKVDRFVWSG